MTAEPFQLVLAAFEMTLVLGGGVFVLWLLASPRRRQRWLGTHALPRWGVSFPEFLLLALLVLAGGFMGQTLCHLAFRSLIQQSPDQEGLAIFVYGLGLQGGMLAGWWLFPRARRFLYADYGTNPVPLGPAETHLPAPDVIRIGLATLLVSIPVLTVLSLGWLEVLRRLGLPDQPQDLIAIFGRTRSPLIIAGMLVVACVLAPIAEELFFRAGLYRYTRQRLGRAPALLINAVCFGALHASWAGFLPLAVLGMIFSLAYEATGSIRVPILAHCLFNLNTILIVLSGLQDLGS